MGKNKNRNLYYYFGRNEKHDYIATPMSNVLYINNPDWGTATFVNNAIIRMIMECNPKEVKIQLARNNRKSFKVWADTFTMDRRVPQIGNIWTWDKNDINSGESFVEYSKEVLQGIISKLEILEEYSAENFTECTNIPWQQYVMIIDDFDSFFEMCVPEDAKFLGTIWSEILKLSEQTGTYFILNVNNPKVLEPYGILDIVKTKVVARVSEEHSELVLGNKDANTLLNSYGDVFVKQADTVHHLYIPFYPDTWIKKFTKYYGVLRS